MMGTQTRGFARSSLHPGLSSSGPVGAVRGVLLVQRMESRLLVLQGAVDALGILPAQAQVYELKGGTFNNLYVTLSWRHGCRSTGGPRAAAHGGTV